MSRIDDQQQPGPSPSQAEERSAAEEPRLLTRPASKERPQAQRPQHAAKKGLQAWAGQLTRRVQRPTAPFSIAQPGSTAPSGNSRPVTAARRRRARLALQITAGTLALLLLVAAIAVLDLRHALKASLPPLDGALHIAGLHAPVTVTRNAQGVPSITAASLDDLLFAQGYITASDRLWQMDGLRRHAAGELAEILGPGLVEHDRRQRFLQMRAAADRAVAALPREQYAQLEAYAHGVNAYLDDHRSALPMEFRLLAYKPAPWSPRDSLLVSLAIYQDMSTEFPGKMNREALSAHLPAALLPDLYPVGSWRDLPPAAQSRNVTAPHEVEQIPLDPSQSRGGAPSGTGAPSLQAGDLLAVSTGFAGPGRCDGCRSGSNNWVVSGQHTASGGPLVSNDMHLSLSLPDIWYEASLHADLLASGTPGDRLDVVGFTLPGVPFVIVGRNTHVAWGLTNLGADVEDLRIEHLRGNGADTEYQKPDGTWALAVHRPERIRVRGGRDLTLDVLTTSHAVGEKAMETPVISPLYRNEKRALSLAWTAYDPSTVTSPFLAINAARDGTSLVAAFESFGGPTLNLVWGDDANHIGYHALGRIPVRGPAVQHPWPATETLPSEAPPGPLPPNEDDQPEPDSAEPAPVRMAPTTFEEDRGRPSIGVRAHAQGQGLSGPHLLLSAFHPVRRHATAAATRARRPVARAAVPVRRRRRRAGAAALRPAAAPTVTAAAAAATVVAPPLANYTIGSPIPMLPVDALDTDAEWSGYIAYADLPAVVDPPNGLLASANSRVTPNGYPWAVADDWTDPFRTERIVHLLSGRNNLSQADMLRTEMDVHSDVDQVLAQRLAYALDHASSKSLSGDAKRLRQAADLLRNWDGNLTTSSAAGAIVAAVRTELWPALLVPQILAHDGAGTDAGQAATLTTLYTWGEGTTALELMLGNQPARWLPHPYTRWSDFLAAVTENAFKASHAPGDLSKWGYGQRHTVEIAHPLLGDQALLSKLLGIPGTSGVRAAPGDGTTIRQMGAHFGPSERFTADLSSPTAAFANLTTGEAGNGISPWYLDQFRAWMGGSTFALPLSGDGATHTLRLLPQ